METLVKRISEIFALVFSCVVLATVAQGAVDPVISGLGKLVNGQQTQISGLGKLVNGQRVELNAAKTDVAALKADVAALQNQPAPSPSPTPAVIVPPATRGWVNSNFASIPDDFDFATFYLAAGLNPQAARNRLADKLSELRKHGNPVYLEIAFAVMADAISVARANAKPAAFTNEDYERIAFDVVGHIKPEDIMTTELVALIEASAGAKATEVAKAELATLTETGKRLMELATSTNQLLSGRATAVDEFKTIACNLEKTLQKYQADVERFAAVKHLDATAVLDLISEVVGQPAVEAQEATEEHTAVEAQEATGVYKTLETIQTRSAQVENAFVEVARALATKNQKKEKEGKIVRETAAVAVSDLGYLIVP